MLAILALFFALLAVILLVHGLKERNATILLFLDIFWWLLALVSAYCVGWVWSERAHTENWTMYVFFLVSVPIIISLSLSVVVTFFVARARKIENMRGLEISYYVLLVFLAAQGVVGLLAGWKG